jgi:hypothetical protein
MSSTVVAKNLQVGADGTASNNFTIYQPASPDGTLRIGNGNTGTTSAQVVLTSAGNVGIGTSSPANFASATALTVNNAGDGVINTQSNGVNGLRIGSGSTSSYLFEARNLPMRFLTNSEERMRINAGAPILCLAGGNTSATGTGIAFPATQNASANANTLDDYEEGTFSTALGNAINLSGTGVLDQTTYTKVGRLVTISGRITGYSIASSNTLTYPTINVPFPMTEQVIAISGSSIMTFNGAWAVGNAVDNSSGDSTSVALVFPPSLITTTGSATIWFSITYSAAA